MIRLHNVSKWQPAPAGSVLHLPGENGRTIEVDLNTETEARVSLVTDGKPVFLASVKGREKLQFSVEDGDVYLGFESEGEVWYYTRDGENTAIERIDAESFTQMMGRRPERNHELEVMMFKMRQNEQRREAVLAEQVAQLAAVQAQVEAEAKAKAAEQASEAAAVAAAAAAAAAADAK